MNSKNSKISEPDRLLLHLLNNINLKWSDKYGVLLNPRIYNTWKKKKKSHTKTINLKYQLQRGIKSLNYMMDHILYQIFKIILNTPLKKLKNGLTNLQ